MRARNFLMYSLCLIGLSACDAKGEKEQEQIDRLDFYTGRICLVEGETAYLYSSTSVYPFTTINIEWDSTSPEVATVDNQGIVSTRLKGETLITASSPLEVFNSYVKVIERNEYWLDGIESCYSDMVWIDDFLVGFSSSSDDLSISGYIEVNEYKNGVFSGRTNVYRARHFLGHCNTVDYNAQSDCLILGNGSGDYSLEGKIIIIPHFKRIIKDEVFFSKQPMTLESVNAIVIDCRQYSLGSKFNLLWGDEDGSRGDYAYLITSNLNGHSYKGGDMEVIRKIEICKNKNVGEFGKFDDKHMPYNGTFNIVETYTQKTNGYANCNQGSCFYNGEINVAVGHDGFWYWRLTLKEGRIFKKEYKTTLSSYQGDRVNSSGMTYRDGYLFVGCSSRGIIFFQL